MYCTEKLFSAATALSYCPERRLVYVGLEGGAVEEFKLARDYNSLDTLRVYHAHQARVTAVVAAAGQAWILSAGRDKYFQFHCTTTGKRLGGYLCTAWCTALAYDSEAQYVFIGDYSGAITVCKLEPSGVRFVNTLKGHRWGANLIRDGFRYYH